MPVYEEEKIIPVCARILPVQNGRVLLEVPLGRGAPRVWPPPEASRTKTRDGTHSESSQGALPESASCGAAARPLKWAVARGGPRPKAPPIQRQLRGQIVAKSQIRPRENAPPPRGVERKPSTVHSAWLRVLLSISTVIIYPVASKP